MAHILLQLEKLRISKIPCPYILSHIIGERARELKNIIQCNTQQGRIPLNKFKFIYKFF